MGWEYLWNWLFRKPPRRPEVHVLLYTRVACSLCDDAAALLVQNQQRYGFVLETKDIDESAELISAYGNCVPVVVIDGKIRFRGKVNEVLLRRILDAK